MARDYTALLEAYVRNTNTVSVFTREGAPLLAELGRFIINFQYLESIMNSIFKEILCNDEKTNLVLVDEINIMGKNTKLCKLLQLRTGNSKFFNDLFKITTQIIEERNFIIHSEIFGHADSLVFKNYPNSIKRFEFVRKRYDLEKLQDMNKRIRDLISLYSMVYMDLIPNDEVPFEADYDSIYERAHEDVDISRRSGR
ncbi:MAG: hypothetical protein ACMUHM_06655 [Thermoplasmatota archaeon]